LIKPFDPSHLRKAVAEAMKKPAQEAAPSAPPALEETVATSAEDLPPMGDHFKMEEVEMPGPELAEADEETPRTPHEPVAVETHKPAVGPEQDESATIDEELREKLQAEVLENDIKDLTESTIKMSGLDEFEWSMDDSRKMKAPEPAKPAQPDITKPISVPPAASTPASTPASPPRQPPPPRFLERPDFAEPEITRPLVRGEDGSPFRNVLGATERSIDDGGSTFPLPGGPAPSTGGAKEEPNPEVPEIEISTSPTGFSPEVEHTDVRRGLAKQKQSSQAQPSRAEIEEIVRKEVRSTVEKAVRELVPQIAESVIRKEIEKLLAEP
jgi:hypothetical protein